MSMDAWLNGNVDGIVADLRQEHIDSEGTEDFPGRLSLARYARMRAYGWIAVYVGRPVDGPYGRVNAAKTLEMISAIVKAVEFLIEERAAEMRAVREAEARDKASA